MLGDLTAAHARFLGSILHPLAAIEERARLITASHRHPYPTTPHLGTRTTHTPKIALGDHLATYADPPAHCHRGEFRGYSDILGNDTLGNCGPCAAIHGTEGINHAAGNPIPPFVTADAIQFYSEEAGYVPGNPSTDQGSDNATMVQHWTDTGIYCSATQTRHKIAGTVFVDPSNEVQNRVAIVEFGALFRAFDMPLSAQGQREWNVVGDGRTGSSAPGSWGGHDVVGMAYDPSFIDFDSWGLWIPASTAFDKAYAIQGFVGLTEEMLSRRGVSPTGLNWSSLNAAFGNLTPGGSAA